MTVTMLNVHFMLQNAGFFFFRKMGVNEGERERNMAQLGMKPMKCLTATLQNHKTLWQKYAKNLISHPIIMKSKQPFDDLFL